MSSGPMSGAGASGGGRDTSSAVRLYEDDGAALMGSADMLDRVSLLPGKVGVPGRAGWTPEPNIRILWGHDMLNDVVNHRYRTVICAVNDQDNTRGILAQLLDLMPDSQFGETAATHYARMFQQSVHTEAGTREPYVVKYDLDKVLILALLRPHSRDYFTLEDLAHGFHTITQMLADRWDRQPVATVSFLGARANRLQGADGREPSFETVLRVMFDAGYRGDVYPSPLMWDYGDTGVFPSYPFPAGLERMREGSS